MSVLHGHQQTCCRFQDSCFCGTRVVRMGAINQPPPEQDSTRGRRRRHMVSTQQVNCLGSAGRIMNVTYSGCSPCIRLPRQAYSGWSQRNGEESGKEVWCLGCDVESSKDMQMRNHQHQLQQSDSLQDELQRCSTKGL